MTASARDLAAGERVLTDPTLVPIGGNDVDKSSGSVDNHVDVWTTLRKTRWMTGDEWSTGWGLGVDGFYRCVDRNGASVRG